MQTVTLGMFAVGFLILVARIAWFWFKSKSSRNWNLLVPFALSVASFAAAGACVGGLLGTVLSWVRGKLGLAGDWVLEKGTGATPVKATHSAEFGTLNAYGAVLMLALVIVSVIVWKTAKRKPKKEISWGAPCGLTLGPFLGAVTIIPLLNSLGTETIGKFFQ
ncbi:hypothetical protein TPA0598_17_00190 [Streptomyces lydicamycinicus]|uniref:Uncharacterized protein n=1 Tax=Streptomyces lydicamycinicus TaxID=1546107 RepID=A0A0P4RGX5_9ACTN|nr:hypothetical protein [Streptomyces lydicamycinicus]GAO13038.1 hypothetical protein TPA0598_17_00190 [Streptomyces lydicamycinicus]